VRVCVWGTWSTPKLQTPNRPSHLFFDKIWSKIDVWWALFGLLQQACVLFISLMLGLHVLETRHVHPSIMRIEKNGTNIHTYACRPELNHCHYRRLEIFDPGLWWVSVPNMLVWICTRDLGCSRDRAWASDGTTGRLTRTRFLAPQDRVHVLIAVVSIQNAHALVMNTCQVPTLRISFDIRNGHPGGIRDKAHHEWA
jgi:hypothetical protein